MLPTEITPSRSDLVADWEWGARHTVPILQASPRSAAHLAAMRPARPRPTTTRPARPTILHQSIVLLRSLGSRRLGVDRISVRAITRPNTVGSNQRLRRQCPVVSLTGPRRFRRCSSRPVEDPLLQRRSSCHPRVIDRGATRLTTPMDHLRRAVLLSCPSAFSSSSLARP